MYNRSPFLYICPVTNQIKVMKHIFEQAISDVNRAYPSIYTKQDVVKLLENLQFVVETVLAEKPKPTTQFATDFEALEKIKKYMLEGVRNISFEDFVELELSYDNRIEITVDERAIAKEIDDCFEVAVTEVLPSPAE